MYKSLTPDKPNNCIGMIGVEKRKILCPSDYIDILVPINHVLPRLEYVYSDTLDFGQLRNIKQSLNY